jgi:hypothetical protein
VSFDFLYNFCLKHFSFEEELSKNITCYSRQILIKLEFSRNIFEKYSNIKFHENLSGGSRAVPYGQTKLSLFGIFRTRLKMKFLLLLHLEQPNWSEAHMG